jgi:predicted RNA-binding Zn-ribbon protein involved in translation (DUF1610 family)
LQEPVITLPFNPDLEENGVGEMVPVQLACPACKKRISTAYSVHSCPHCGEPLSNEWEETGRKELSRRRIAFAILLVPVLAVVLFFGAAVLAGVYEVLTGSPELQPQRVAKPASNPSTQVILQNPGGSALRVSVWKNTQAHTEAIKLIMAGVHKTNPALILQLTACMVPSGTSAIITDAGFATHDILVTSGEFSGCRGNIAVEDVQRPMTTSAPSAPATIGAFAFKLRDGQRGLFVGARERLVVLGGQEVRVLCMTDGIGHIVAAVNGDYVGVNGTARDWTQSKSLWVVQGGQLVLVQDSGFPNEVPKRFEVLERQSDAMIKIGTEMCPFPASPVMYDLLMAAVRSYSANSQSLGVTVP